MLQLCVCREIEHLGRLESTQEARVAEFLPLFQALQTFSVLIISTYACWRVS